LRHIRGQGNSEGSWVICSHGNQRGKRSGDHRRIRLATILRAIIRILIAVRKGFRLYLWRNRLFFNDPFNFRTGGKRTVVINIDCNRTWSTVTIGINRQEGKNFRQGIFGSRSSVAIVWIVIRMEDIIIQRIAPGSVIVDRQGTIRPWNSD